jgi:thymidine phosphorylase
MVSAYDDGTPPPTLKARRLGLISQHEAIILMRSDCHVCRAEGLEARAQIIVSTPEGREAYATLYEVAGDWLSNGEAGLSEALWEKLAATNGVDLSIRHAPPLESLSDVRRRIHGNRLNGQSFRHIVDDVAGGRYTDIHLAAFLTASSALPLDRNEIAELTRAMVSAGDTVAWSQAVVMDKHCVGGLPGNRTTPIVVAIATVYGLTMPKTSSRAITSPAGTADVMETLAPVDLDLAAMRRVVEQEGGCIVWGRSVNLSPADDVFIRVEKVLDIDTEGQLIASVLSKKIAAGATHVVLDIPVGATAKVRTDYDAARIAASLTAIAGEFGISAHCLFSDGAQPVGRGIGPALEAMDVLAVLRKDAAAPQDLRRRACALAGAILEMGNVVAGGKGVAAAEAALDDGRAWSKFQAICTAQGGVRTPPLAQYVTPLVARQGGRVVHINNRKLARLAKLAGAPGAKAAGLRMLARLGDEVAAGQPILEIHAESPGELAYALDYAARNSDIIEVEP